MSRHERRNNDPEVQRKREAYAANGGNMGVSAPPPLSSPGKGGADAGGYGMGNKVSVPATGQSPNVNPFMIPKSTGINVISQTFPSNYYVEWNLTTWRAACDQAIKMGYCTSIATLYSWAFECSPFIQSLFNKLGAALDRVDFFVVDAKGNRMDDQTAELCDKPWQMQLRREVLFSYFWGFSGLNFDPLEGKVYKYPMQQIDPINRLLKASTYSFYDGMKFAETANLLFVQPSTNYESFLGWMQPITRSFIMQNLTKNNWVSAGRRLAFPLMTVGYPQNDGAQDGNGNPLNPYRLQAEAVAANIDPGQGLVYPYTLDSAGNIQKAIDVDFENPGSGANIHKIYSEFNATEKDEIREMIFGGSLTSTTQANGNRSLGEVQERMLDAVVASKLKYVLSVMNTDYIPKISLFYEDGFLPEGWKFDVPREKKMTIEEIAAISKVVVQNGKRFNDEFFQANGIAKEFLEDAPTPAPAAGFGDDEEEGEEKEVKNRTGRLFSQKKK